MVKTKMVSVKDIFNENNPTSYLSVERVFEDCHKCQTYINAYHNKRESKLRCKPKIKPKILKLLLKKRKLSAEYFKQTKQIEKDIETLS